MDQLNQSSCYKIEAKKNQDRKQIIQTHYFKMEQRAITVCAALL